MRILITLLLITVGFLSRLSGQSYDSSFVDEVDSLVLHTKSIWYSDSEESLRLANSVLSKSLEKSYQLGEAKGYNLLGVINSIKGDFAESMLCYKKAADIFRVLGDLDGLASCQYNMGLMLQDDEQFEEALKNVQDAYLYYQKTGVRSNIAMSSMTLGNLYLTNNKGLKAAIKKMKESAEISRADGDTLMLCYALSLQGDALVEYDGSIQTAIQLFTESIDLMNLRQPDNHWSLGFSHLGLAKSFLIKGELKKALDNNNQALNEYAYQKQKLGFRNVYENRIEILEGMDDHLMELDAYKMLKVYTDSIYREESSKQLNRLNAEYQTDKKEAEIASLSQQASIQALEIKQKNQAMITGIGATLFVLVVIYFLYRQRETKKQQSQTELEQRFLRSQLNPHFISNALVAVQSFMLTNDSESAALYLTKFSKLMREILENSRKEFIPVEEEISMLRNYLDIHKLRLSSFDFNIELDDNIDPELDTIPPMFVQPFVENAVEHGIANIANGQINLRFRKEGDFISIEVSDNGKGLNQTSKADHNSLSSTIIRERMEVFNKSLKKKIELFVDDLKNDKNEVCGTQVELKVPFRYI